MPEAPRPPAPQASSEKKSFGLWLETAPDGVLAAIAIPFFFVLLEVLMFAAGRPLPFIPRGPLGQVFVVAIAVAIGMFFPRYRNMTQQMRPTGRITFDLWKAIRESRLPDDADPAEWRPAVEFHASTFATAQKNAGKAFLGFAVFVVVGFVISFLFGMLLLALFVGCGVAVLVRRTTLPPRIAAVRAQLAAREEQRADTAD